MRIQIIIIMVLRSSTGKANSKHSQASVTNEQPSFCSMDAEELERSGSFKNS